MCAYSFWMLCRKLKDSCMSNIMVSIFITSVGFDLRVANKYDDIDAVANEVDDLSMIANRYRRKTFYTYSLCHRQFLHALVCLWM